MAKEIQKTTKHTIFVYGTLKKGFSNSMLLKGSDFLGAGQTKEEFALYSSGIPFVIKDEAVSTIQGEVYSVTDAILKDLDQLEGHPDCYYREKTRILLKDDEVEVNAWLYFYPQPTGKLLPNGHYPSV